MKTIKETEQQYVMKGMGEHLGYPQCCIDWFVDIRLYGGGGELTDEQEAVHDGHGFIPCPKCAQRLIETGETSATLIKNRKHPEKFPYELRPFMELQKIILREKYKKNSLK